MASVLLSIQDEIAEVDTLEEESLSFGSLYLIQGEILNSKLQPRPTRRASDLSQVRSIVDCGNITRHHGGDKLCLGQSPKAGELEKQARDSYICLFFFQENREEYL